MANNPTFGNSEPPTGRNISSSHGQRSILTPEVSNLIENVNELANTVNDLVIKNFELLKMARVPGDSLEILEPLTLQIAGVEENIESIVRRNDVVDGEIQGMKTDILSLSEKILAIKVSFKNTRL